MIHLADRRKENRNHMVKRLTKCNFELAELVRKATVTQSKSTPYTRTLKQRARSVSSASPFTQIRDHANLLYQLLVQNWKCQGHSPHTETSVRLATHRGDTREAKFDMVFSCTSTISTKWQEGEVLLLSRNKYV